MAVKTKFNLKYYGRVYFCTNVSKKFSVCKFRADFCHKDKRRTFLGSSSIQLPKYIVF
jgi:hypothetical protein